MNELEQFGNIPVDSAVLYGLMDRYKFKRNKVASMEKRGDIVRLKKGLYVVSNKISRKPLSRELIANHLYGPSYVSFETALAFYGLIPEKVFAVRSATFKRAKRFENAVGNFEYITLPPAYYSIGINLQTVDDEYTYMIATPEKALCDLILATPNLRLQSVKAMQIYLEENMRIDFSAVEHWNVEIVRQCFEEGRKKGELGLLLRLFSVQIKQILADINLLK
jgi:predicted transcriptional regulator of viral defense system